MRRTKLRRIAACSAVIACAVALALAATGGASPHSRSGVRKVAGGQTQTLTFGLLTPLSGSAASFGFDEKTSAEVAIQEINGKGGIKVGNQTIKLALKTFDTAYDPTLAATAASQAIQQDGLKFIEDLGGGTIPAVQPIAERAGAMVFCSCTGYSFLGKKHPLTFRDYFDDAASLASDLKYFKQKNPGATRIAQIYPDDDVGHATIPPTEKTIAQLKMKSSIYYVQRGSTDLSPLLTKVLAGHPSVIDFGPSDEGTYQALVKQASQLGFKGPYIFPDSFDLPTDEKAVPKAALVGSLVSPCDQAGAVTPEAKYWLSAYEKIAHQPPEWWSAQTHDSLLILAKAIHQAQSLDPTKVAAVMGQQTVAGATAGGSQVHYDQANVYGLPRAFVVPYPVCAVTAGSANGAESLTQVSRG